MNNNKLITNADDLGWSKGVNQAILLASNEGYLSHASLMANTENFMHAVEHVIPNAPKLKVGLHVNLTCDLALSGKSIITDDKGFLNNTFLKLLFLRKSKNTLAKIENEIELQIQKLIEHNVDISHIDGNEHVHIIPSINKIVRKLANKYNIERVREINERLKTTFKYNLRTASLVNVLKLFLLKFLNSFNSNTNEIEFYTILNTCELNSRNLFSYLEAQHGKTIEIMLHPSLVEFNDNLENLDPRFLEFFTTHFRRQEFDLCFDEKFKDYEFLK